MRLRTLEQVYNDMKHGVYNFTENGKCTSCGNCCTALLPMTKEELKTIQRYVKRKRVKVVKHNGVGFDLTCPFRDDEKRICMIYEIRHFIRRTFLCNKPQNEIERNKDRLSFDSRFHVVNLRDIF